MSPLQVAKKMMSYEAKSPEDWLDYLKECGSGLQESADSDMTEHKSEDEAEDEVSDGKESSDQMAEDEDEDEDEDYGAPKAAPPIFVLRLRAAKKAVKGQK